MDLPSALALFASRLKAARLSRGYLSARQFARAIGIDENRYTRYERGEIEPGFAILLRICTALGTTPNELLLESGKAVEIAQRRKGEPQADRDSGDND
jgi:transcriptional regulator with XRE-family HTH domain